MSVSIADVTKVLENDPNILSQIVKVADILKIPTASSKQIINLYNMGNKPGYELLRDFLIIWVSRQGLENSTIGSLSTLLQQNGFRAVAGCLSNLGPSSMQITCSIVNQVKQLSNTPLIKFGITPPNLKFVGRSLELADLQFQYKNPSINCLVVSGMGGQGKSELCKKFIHQNPQPSPSFVTWLHGDTYQQLTTSFQNLAQFLKLSINDDSGKPLQIKQLIQQISNHFKTLLNSSPRWFIIIDNVDEEYSEFEEILQTLLNPIDFNIFVLITSRRKNIGGEFEQLQLQTLNATDAQLLMTNIVPDSSEEDIALLCEELGNHALALQQAGAYIRQKQRTSIKGCFYSIQDYLDEFKKTQKKILKHSLRFSNYDKTIHGIVQTTLDNMRSKTEDEIIWTEEVGIILGLVSPDGIHIKFLHKLIHIYIFLNSLVNEWSEENTEAVVLKLTKFSLINVKNEIISLHRLVQAVFRIECDFKPYIHIFLNRLDFEKASKVELFHFRSIWNHVSAYPEIVKKCPTIPYKVFMEMQQLSLVLELTEFAQKNHTLLDQVLGPQHESTLEMELNVALALEKMGEYDEALTTNYKVLEKMKLVLGEDHSLSMVAANEIAIVLYQMGKLEEALEWNEKVLKSRQIVLGDKHLYTMITRNNIAVVLDALGRRKEALSIYDDVLKWREENLGPSHPLTLTTRHNRAILLKKEGQLSEAKAEFEAVLEIRIQILGEEHMGTLTTKACLAYTLWDLGEKKKALEMMEDVFVGQEKVLGVNHTETKKTESLVFKYKMEISEAAEI